MIILISAVSIAAYSVNEVPHMKEPRSPAYSFGAKPAVLSRATSPAPNAYTLPSMTGSGVVGRQSSASYSLTGRSKIGSFHEDLKKVRPTIVLTLHHHIAVEGRGHSWRASD